nr:MAG TPA_asm: hypothetical protein [Caudoviricetes sp.]
MSWSIIYFLAQLTRIIFVYLYVIFHIYFHLHIRHKITITFLFCSSK